MCDKGEHNYVADAQNWEQRVKGEMEATRIWEAHWGDLYAKGQPRTYEEKIERIQKEMMSLPIPRMITNTMLDYIPVKPYQEWQDYKRKSLEKMLSMSELARLEAEENTRISKKHNKIVLGVSKSSTVNEIKNAYRVLAKKWHPDKNLAMTKEAEVMFKKVSDAYTILSDATKRNLYDRMVFDGGKSQGLILRYDSREVYRSFFADGGDPFSNLNIHDIQEFKSHKKPNTNDATTANVSSNKVQETCEINVPCTLEDFFWGSEKKVRIERRIRRDGVCYTEEKVLTVVIQAGASDKTTLIVQNEGDDGRDLTFVLKEEKHDLFKRDVTGLNLIHYVQIPLVKALTGSVIPIPTLSGRRIWLAIPEVIHPRYERIVRGEGMPKSIGDRNTRGDLIIRFHIQFPLSLSYNVRNRLKTALDDASEERV